MDALPNIEFKFDLSRIKYSLADTMINAIFCIIRDQLYTASTECQWKKE